MSEFAGGILERDSREGNAGGNLEDGIARRESQEGSVEGKRMSEFAGGNREREARGEIARMES